MAPVTPRTITSNEYRARREASLLLESAYNEATFRAMQRETRDDAIPAMLTIHHAWGYLFLEKVIITEDTKRCDSKEPHGGAGCCYPSGHTHSHGTGGYNSVSW